MTCSLTRQKPFMFLWGLIVLVQSISLCFVPLFNLLAFEFAFAMSIPITLGAGILGARTARSNAVWTDRLTFISRRLLVIWALTLTPILLNAFRVKNCNLVEGLNLFIIFPVIGTIVAVLWGIAWEELRPGRGVRNYVAFWLAIALLGGWRFVIHPPVDIYSTLLGYWPGALYDDVFLVEGRLLISRAEDLLMALFAAYTLTNWPSIRRRQNPHFGLFICLFASVVGVHLAAESTGVYRNATYVQQALGGHKKTVHFDIYYPQKWSSKTAASLGTELEFDHSELKIFFGQSPSQRIQVYLYSNRAQKKKLMGARRTRIAKPWQWAFHVDSPSVGLATLTHEMAHVFAAAMGKAPHRLSIGANGLPNMGLIEGVAEAATWPGSRLDLHQWTAAMHTLKLAPKIEVLLEPHRFYQQHGRTAYTLCGSFARYVHEEVTPDVLWNAYTEGQFPQSGGFSLSVLSRGWLAFLKGQTVPEHALAEAKNRFDRPSIFGRVCAREIAALWRSHGQAQKRNDLTVALSLLDQILNHLPNNPNGRIARMRHLTKLNRLTEARQLASRLSIDPKAGGVARSLATEQLADLDVLSKDFKGARHRYAQVATAVFNRARMRAIRVKEAALKDELLAPMVLRYLSQRKQTRTRIRSLAEIETARGSSPVLLYLQARAMLGLKNVQPALDCLNRAAVQLNAVELRYESLRLIAQLAFSRGCYSEARDGYDRLASRIDLGLLNNEVAELKRWSRRSHFFDSAKENLHRKCPIKIDKHVFDTEYAPNPEAH
jgi:hypothetical protein